MSETFIGQFVEVKIKPRDGNFYFRGRLLEETDSYIMINEIRKGKMKINKNNIMYISDGEEKPQVKIKYGKRTTESTAGSNGK